MFGMTWLLVAASLLPQALVDTLDKRYVKAVGFMMHLNGYPDEKKMPLSQQFLQVSDCFVSQTLILIHCNKDPACTHDLNGYPNA